MLCRMLALTALTAVVSHVQAQTFSGNGATGFGGAIGNATLTASNAANAKVNFQIAANNNFGGNPVVFYLDTKSGGIANTSTLNDMADNYRTAISGVSFVGRTLANFPTGFNADYAIAFDPSMSFAGVFNLSTPNSLTFVESAAATTTGNNTYSFSFTRSLVGLGSSDDFKFVGSLISGSGYRSNETFGTSVTIPGMLFDTPNAGFEGTTTFTSSFATAPVPEPVFIGLLMAGGLAGWRKKR